MIMQGGVDRCRLDEETKLGDRFGEPLAATELVRLFECHEGPVVPGSRIVDPCLGIRQSVDPPPLA